MRWNVINLRYTKAFVAVFRTDFVEKTVPRLKTNGWNAIEIDVFRVENPNRAANDDD